MRSQGACFQGDGGITVLCTMFLVSSSINVSIFYITWLNIFWADLVYIHGLPTSQLKNWQVLVLTCHEYNRDLACSIPSVSLHPKCLLYCHTGVDPAVHLNKGNELLKITAV